MKKLLFLLCFVTAFQLTAQTKKTQYSFTITGKVVDKEGQKPLEAATIFVRSVKDSTLVNYTISDVKGDFTLKGKTTDNQVVIFVNHVAHQPYKKQISTPNGTHHLGIISMETKAQELEGVVVSQEAVPITVKKDTLEFNADAFKLRPDATVEQLLKNLPGVEVDSQGKITVNGTPVNEILVNGKPFFDDPKVATKNLTKDIVQKIQVSDTKTKEQKFTKEQGDPDNKSINIVLKKDKNKGYFGRITAGAGTKGRYELNGIGNYFKDKTRVSVLGGSNNINTMGFEFDEIYGMMGNVGDISGGRGGIMSGGRDGISQSHIGGISYTDEYGKSIETNANYFYSTTDNEHFSKSERQTTLPDRQYFSSRQNSGNSWGDNHSAKAELEYKLDSLTQISVNPRLTSGRNHSFSHSQEQSLDNQYVMINKSNSENTSESANVNFSNRVSFNRRFKERGSWGVNFHNSNSRSEREQFIYNIREIYGAMPSTDIRNQQQNGRNTSDTYGVGLRLRYPITKEISITAAYDFSHGKIKNDIDTYDKVGVSYTNFNTALSSDFQTDNKRHSPQVGMEWQGEKLRGNFNLGTTHTELENEDFLRNLYLNKKFNDFRANSWLRYEIKKGFNITFNYNGNTNIPSVSQLQPIENITNPLHTFTGNPDLKTSFSHNLSFNINNFDWQKRSGIFVWARASFHNDKITSITLTNSDLTRRTTYTNIDGDYNFSLGANWRKSHKQEKHTIKYGINPYASIEENNLYSNGTRYALTNYTLNLGGDFGYNYDEKLDLSLNYRANFNQARYDLDLFENKNYTGHSVGFDITTYVPKNVIFGSNIEYSYLPYLGEGFKKNYIYWNFSVGYKFWDEKATIQLKGFDLLNQIVDTNRIITQDYVEDTQKLMLKQYFMLSFSYKINKTGGNSSQQRPRAMNFGRRR